MDHKLDQLIIELKGGVIKKYKVNIEELGYEEIIEAEDESEADALVHCKMYLQEYVNAEVER